ncbi:MAG: class I SAM-dependent methyltransferase [Candidatus Omnitrophica bacterium]|nr:class I SAM-dependent methyltransferase [Candidatus Omnitrophota bacterium]
MKKPTPPPDAIFRPGPRGVGRYQRASVMVDFMGACGWGQPLLNLGYYRFYDIHSLITGFNSGQRRLAKFSIALLDLQSSDVVLDAGCGFGWTTSRIASQAARAIGLDIAEAHVRAARQTYPASERLEFILGDATRLWETLEARGFGEASLDKIHCLESAFHFGFPGREVFLKDAFRLLTPGGRLVLVDFMWRSAQPAEIEAADPAGIVRQTWQFESFESMERYRAMARDCGFAERRLLDWSEPVLQRCQRIGQGVLWCGQRPATRWALCAMRSAFRRLTPEDWILLAEVLRAHDEVRRRLRYIALVLEKPPGAGRR